MAASRRCCRPAGTTLTGVEAVIDKDLASELLARELDADLFVMATDVDAVYADWGTPEQRALDRVTPDGAARPRVRGRLDGARRSRPRCRFVEATGGRAAIGSLDRDRADRRRHSGHPGRRPDRPDRRRRA